jgi:fluoride exporter
VRAALVAVAASVGALIRYGIAITVGVRSFPWPTLAINVAGSFALGVVLTLAIERRWSDTVTVPLAIGFLGTFTTFSTFSYETFALLRDERFTAAGGYLGASLLGGVLAAGAGYAAARAIG